MSRPAGRRLLRIAHRGASAGAPENTLAAFEAAILAGCDAIELDVRLSADGTPVVIHDGTVDRTTDGHGTVGSLTLPQLRALDAGDWFAPRFRGQRIPTLGEALECVRGRCGINIEIKEVEHGRPRGRAPSQGTPLRALVAAVAATVERVRFRDLLIVSSFSPPALILARQAMPRAALGLLSSRSLRGLRAVHRQVALHAVHPHLRLATRRRILAAHRLGLVVLVWPVNDRRQIQRLDDLGADGVMSDDPRLFCGLDHARLDKAGGL